MDRVVALAGQWLHCMLPLSDTKRSRDTHVKRCKDRAHFYHQAQSQIVKPMIKARTNTCSSTTKSKNTNRNNKNANNNNSRSKE